MNERRKERERTFLVQCIWCGSKIRDDKEEEAKGVCLKCFYQILNNHLRAQKRSVYGDFVSDR
jgi:DNA-directed RNA polymerase subunit RPC12/RpoP